MGFEYDGWFLSEPGTEHPGAHGEWPYACAHAFFDEARGLAVASTGLGGGAVTLLPTFQVQSAVISAAAAMDPTSSGGDALVQLFRTVDRTIGALATTDPEGFRYHGACMEAVAALHRGGALWLCAVGLCRAYRVRAGEVRQVTEDESLLTEYQRSLGGKLTQEELDAFPHQNIVTGTLGAPVRPSFTLVEEAPRAGDVYVLCTEEIWRARQTEQRFALLAAATAPRSARGLWQDARPHRDPARRRGLHWYDSQAAVVLLRYR